MTLLHSVFIARKATKQKGYVINIARAISAVGLESRARPGTILESFHKHPHHLSHIPRTFWRPIVKKKKNAPEKPKPGRQSARARAAKAKAKAKSKASATKPKAGDGDGDEKLPPKKSRRKTQ